MEYLNENIVNRIRDSGLPYFDTLATALKDSTNIGIDLIKHGYQARCYMTINSMLRKDENFDDSNWMLINDIANKINEALELNFENHNNQIVWRHDWPSTSSQNDDENVLNWFKENLGKVLLFPSFISCYSIRNRLPYQERFFEITTLIERSKAFNISDLNPNHPEAEILFQTNSKFLITEVIEEQFIVKLRETANCADFVVKEFSAFHESQL